MEASPSSLQEPAAGEGCQGYDTVFGSMRNVAVRGEQRQEGSMAMEMQYKVCQSLEEVRCMLQLEQSSILGCFSAGSHQHSSDKLRFFNSLNFSTHSVAIVLYAKLVTGGHTIRNASLSVAAPKSQAEVEQFVRLYGDSYLSKVEMGGEYYACFTYCAEAREEKMHLLAKMKKDGVFSWDSKFGGKIVKFNSLHNLSMEFWQALRGISGVVLPEPTHLADFVLKLPTLTVDKPQILRFECLSYEHAGVPVLYFGSLMHNRGLIVENSTFLHLLYKVKVLETDVQAIEEKMQQYGMYKGPARSFMDEVKRDLEIDRAAVQAVMQSYKDRASSIGFLPPPSKFMSLEHEERIHGRCWTEVPSLYVGGLGGATSDYVTNIGEFMRSCRRIVSIQLCSGSRINKILIKYNNGDKFECGGMGGTWSNVLYVPETEHFSKIRIKDNGYYIGFLEFVLSNGSSLAGGDVNSDGAQDITYEPQKDPDYHYFCGFQVRSGWYIDGLRAIFAKLRL